MAGSYKGKIDSKTRTGGFKGQNVYRADEKKANMLKMLTETGNAKRDRDGKIVKEAAFQSKDAQPGRVQADRRWFGESPFSSSLFSTSFQPSFHSRTNFQKDPH